MGWGESLRCGGGDGGLKPGPFSCNHFFIDHLGAFEDVWVGVGADARVWGGGPVNGGGGGGWQGVFAGG